MEAGLGTRLPAAAVKVSTETRQGVKMKTGPWCPWSGHGVALLASLPQPPACSPRLVCHCDGMIAWISSIGAPFPCLESLSLFRMERAKRRASQTWEEWARPDLVCFFTSQFCSHTSPSWLCLFPSPSNYFRWNTDWRWIWKITVH